MEKYHNHTVNHFHEFSPLIRKSIEASSAILITHGHRVTPPVSPSAIKHFTTLPIKKFQQFNPRSKGINIGELAIGSYRANRGCSPQQGLNSADSAPLDSRSYWSRFRQRGWFHHDGVKCSQKWTTRISNFLTSSLVPFS